MRVTVDGMLRPHHGTTLLAASLVVVLANACGPADAGTAEGGGDGGPGFVNSSNDAGPGSGLGSLAACATSQQEATLKPLNLVFLYDKSGSMGDKMRISSCGGGDVVCQTLTLTGPSGNSDLYACYPAGQLGALTFPNATSANYNGSPCPSGTVGGEPAILCASPAGCSQTLFFDPAAKWVPVGQAVETFFADPKSAGLSASMGFFPKQGAGGTMCQPSAYETPAVAMQALPNAAAFKGAIASETPRGNTPTEIALKGTIAYAKTVAAARPNEITAIVLVSDGDPTECGDATPQAIGVVKGVAQAAAADAKTPLKTYVIGVGASLTNLNEIAAGGGTSTATLVTVGNPAKTSADLLAALEAIRGKELSCNVPLPSPPDGKKLDINAVNVVANINGVDDVLTYNKDCTGGTGWHYDDANAPARVELCPATCSDIRAKKGKLSIAFGCATKGGVVR